MPQDPDPRPDPDALLAAITPEAPRGRLKIFLGAAPGVGKTYEMLAQAGRRAASGTDVVAGLIETHGRAETLAQLGALPVLPRRPVAYRGRTLEEFDLEAALARRPALLLLDELAHSNAPGSRHAKRWEDAADLIAAGIDVWTTLNVQHLESLNDDVARITGIRPTETLPDRVLEMADEIELVDLPPAELRARLREGRIYRADQATRALEHFFREGNLAALREMALRRAAAHVDGSLRDWMRRAGVEGPWPASEAVVALVGADDSAEAVVRTARRLAAALRAPWTALYVETAAAEPPAVRRAMALAGQLGAGLVVAPAAGRDLPAALLQEAAAANATHVVIGRGRGVWWRRAIGRTLAATLLREDRGFALHVVPRPDRRPVVAAPAPAPAAPWQAWAVAAGLVGAVTALGVALRPVLPVEAADMVYLAVVVASAMAYGRGPALLAAALGVLAWDFFFIPPLYTVTIERPRDLLTASVFGVVAVLTGNLAGRARAEARAAQARIETLRRIGEFSRRLAAPAVEAELLPEIASQAALLCGGAAVVLTGDGADLEPVAAAPTEVRLDEAAWAAARWAATRGEPAGTATSTLPGAGLRFMPLRTARGALGALGVALVAEPDAARLQALEALADQASVALERVRLAAEAASAAALRDTQTLRTALLASLSHDLRTPLAGIQGAAGTLRGAWADLPEATRADLLASIEQDVGRMARFLANIADLTRLESGEVRPRTETVALAPVVEAAIARLADPLPVATRVEASLRVRADPALLEQAVFNVLDNAVKYSPHGGIVRVAARARGGQVVITVADEGVGIPAADLPHVFDSFFRARRGDRAAPGTGLGLAIARGLLVAMGGTIAAESPNPEAPRDGNPGTVLRLSVPAA